jgi:hypothetical protein
MELLVVPFLLYNYISQQTMKKYDAILYIDSDNMITEMDRKNAGRPVSGVNRFFQGSANWDDPKLYSSMSFGQLLKSTLNNMGGGWSCKVTDFKKWVVVEMSHHDTVTGRSSSKTFLIVFQEKGNGLVLSTHNKYRSISGVEQAISYIKSASNALKDSNQNKL